MDELLFVLIGTERGVVRYVEPLFEPVSERHAIERADKMFSKNKGLGVKVVVWYVTTEKVIYTAS